MIKNTITQEINEKDLVCAGRIIQSALFHNSTGIFNGCKFCAYSNECTKTFKETGEIYFDLLRKKLQDMTGVDLNFSYNPNIPEAKFK